MLSSYASNVVIDDSQAVTFDTNNLQYKVHEIRPGHARSVELASFKASFVNDTDEVMINIFIH